MVAAAAVAAAARHVTELARATEYDDDDDDDDLVRVSASLSASSSSPSAGSSSSVRPAEGEERGSEGAGGVVEAAPTWHSPRGVGGAGRSRRHEQLFVAVQQLGGAAALAAKERALDEGPRPCAAATSSGAGRHVHRSRIVRRVCTALASPDVPNCNSAILHTANSRSVVVGVTARRAGARTVRGSRRRPPRQRPARRGRAARRRRRRSTAAAVAAPSRLLGFAAAARRSACGIDLEGRVQGGEAARAEPSPCGGANELQREEGLVGGGGGGGGGGSGGPSPERSRAPVGAERSASATRSGGGCDGASFGRAAGSASAAGGRQSCAAKPETARAVRRRRVRLRRAAGRSWTVARTGEARRAASAASSRRSSSWARARQRWRRAVGSAQRRRRRLRRLGRAVGRRAAPGVGAVAVVGVGEPQEGIGEAFVVGVLLRRPHSFLDAL